MNSELFDVLLPLFLSLDSYFGVFSRRALISVVGDFVVN